MLTSDKRTPCFEDTDPMPFGKHRGKLMQDVPPQYFRWLWQDGNGSTLTGKEVTTQTKPHARDMIMVSNYIFNSKEAIEQELGHEI